MQLSSDNLISRLSFEAQELVSSHPPQFHHANKQLLYDYACPPSCHHTGRISFTRWGALVLPYSFRPADCHTNLEARQGFYGYEPSPKNQEPTVVWYVNFAHYDLFASYGLGVFAQDEIQVAEHPVLASLREALAVSDAKSLTVEDGLPTPILIMGAERRCAVDTDRNEKAGRPQGLYGRQFALAKAETILNSTSLIEPPTITNLIAMEAPSYGRGIYTEEQISHILTTAFTGFSAACHESHKEGRPPSEVVIHTGFWGCGAYGGNRVLMALLQLWAAHLSRVNRLVFHISDSSGAEALATARHLWEEDLLTSEKGRGWVSSLLSVFRKASSHTKIELLTSEIVSRVQAREFQWGESDGN